MYRARDVRTGRLVAIKILHGHLARDPAYLERFRREARIALALDSRHIVQVLDFGHEGESNYLVMEYVEGASLRNLLRRRGMLAPQEALPIAIQVARALEEAHSKNVVHRDIKPENIMVAQDGSVKVADFGVAKAEDYSSLTITGALLGTVQYMAPEFLRGYSGPASDIYSLGVVLYQMLAGVVPFEAETPWDVMRMHVEAKPPSLTGHGSPVRPEVEQVVMRCLAKEPSERYARAFDLRRDLERLQESLASGGSPGQLATVQAARLIVQDAGLSDRLAGLGTRPLALLAASVGGVASGLGRGLRAALRSPAAAGKALPGLVGGMARWVWPAMRRAPGMLASAAALVWPRRPKGRAASPGYRRPSLALSMRLRLPHIRLDLRILFSIVAVVLATSAGYAAFRALERGSGDSGGSAIAVLPSATRTLPTVVPTVPPLTGTLAVTGTSGQLLVGEPGGYPLPQAIGNVAHPAFAPGGDRLAFVSVVGQGRAAAPGDIMVLDLSTGRAVSVVRASQCEADASQSALLHNPRWWPDASAILYQEDCPDPTGHGVRSRVLKWHNLYSEPGESAADPVVDLREFEDSHLLGEPANIGSFDVSAADGSIAIELLCKNRNCVRLALLEPGGFAGQARILLDPQGDESYGGPSWSPDGSKLAYYYKLGSQWHLRMWDLRSNPIDLAVVEPSDQAPLGYWATTAWSPDGAYIAFQHQNAIWVVEAKAGAEPKRLGGGLYPAWAGERKPSLAIPPPALILPTPSPTPSATLTPAPTATFTPVPTDTATPTVTPRPVRTPTASPTAFLFPH